HVERRDAFGDADDDRHLCARCLKNSVRCERRRDEDERDVGVGLRDGVFHRVEDGYAFRCFAAAAGRDAADDVGAVLDAAAGLEGALFAGDALDYESRFFADEDAHAVALAGSFCLTQSAMRSIACWPSGSIGANSGKTWIISSQTSSVTSTLAAFAFSAYVFESSSNISASPTMINID